MNFFLIIYSRFF